MSNTNLIEKLNRYFHRQLELEEGTARENVYSLFAESYSVRFDNGTTVDREKLVKMAEATRQVPKAERSVKLTDMVQRGNEVTGVMHVKSKNQETGELVTFQTRFTWVFNEAGKVIEGRPHENEKLGNNIQDLGIKE